MPKHFTDEMDDLFSELDDNIHEEQTDTKEGDEVLREIEKLSQRQIQLKGRLRTLAQTIRDFQKQGWPPSLSGKGSLVKVFQEISDLTEELERTIHLETQLVAKYKDNADDFKRHSKGDMKAMRNKIQFLHETVNHHLPKG